jgi:hypothetical protein
MVLFEKGILWNGTTSNDVELVTRILVDGNQILTIPIPSRRFHNSKFRRCSFTGILLNYV